MSPLEEYNLTNDNLNSVIDQFIFKIEKALNPTKETSADNIYGSFSSAQRCLNSIIKVLPMKKGIFINRKSLVFNLF